MESNIGRFVKAKRIAGILVESCVGGLITSTLVFFRYYGDALCFAGRMIIASFLSLLSSAFDRCFDLERLGLVHQPGQFRVKD